MCEEDVKDTLPSRRVIGGENVPLDYAPQTDPGGE